MLFWDKILSDLIGVVGWRQSTITGAVTVSAENLASSSGLYVQGAHPMVTVKNLKATQEDSTVEDNEMNTILQNIMKDGISNVINFVFPEIDVFKRDLLYKNESDFTDTITDRSGFVGFKLNIANRQDVVSILNEAILQFDGAGTVKLLLFNSGMNELVTSKEITVTANTNTKSALDWVLGYITAPGGSYFVGYLNSSLGFNAYNRSFSYANLMTRFNSITFQPVYVNDWNSETLFDINDIVYTNESFGLNFAVTTARDYSNVVLQNKDRFAKAIQLATAVEALRLMNTTSRSNIEERVIMNVFNQRIVIDSPLTYNLYSTLEKEMNSLKSLFGMAQIKTGTVR